MKNIWQTFTKPFFALAPMENVTDTVFRRIVGMCGKPDVYFTEFTAVDGMLSKGKERVVHRLQFTEVERPIIAQIWGSNPDHFVEAAKMIQERGFDGIDINMGCPDRSIVKNGSCAALIQDPQRAKEIFLATKEGAGELPVSVKTRCGLRKWETETWIDFLLSLEPDALTIHGRIASEMSHFPARWEEIKKGVALRDARKSKTLIIGNGDVTSNQDGLDKIKHYGVDGVMVGRGIFHDLWIFNPSAHTTITMKEKLEMLIQHIELFEATWGKTKKVEILKKFYKVYVSGMPNASDIRMKLMELRTSEETIAYIHSLIATYA